jgi:uncharacterized protein YecT (DUF1311 family)
MIGFLAALVMAAQGSALECDDPQTQIEMTLCARRDYEEADARLNHQWAVTAARMKALDQDILREQDQQPGYFETLLAAQRAWLQFRDAHCLSESFLGRGGSVQPMLDSGCKAYLTELRIQQLVHLAGEPAQ